MHRFTAQALTRRESEINNLKNELNRINRLIESRQGSAAMDYYTNQKTELEQKITKKQSELEKAKIRLNVTE
ncbi:hypothetical protein GCM10011409_45310 [Lentibacillus populi]|uniref:Uncharacterized protein n=1 Tax=Lentibacillus populi TaxID=1827502 RepID=A0A9W5U216_9BACI|nr:hypothetical protein [Lentibacillus populi]GGB63156.1 hypothetical protein GCM10011409_45310 [Lentibacillus populi]